MTLYFAYGSNMSRSLMRRRCPQARALGTARLDGWRYVITHEGYASIAPANGQGVHGVLWRLSPRDRAALDVYEDVESGTYRRRMLSITYAGKRRLALVYVARAMPGGWPKPGYQRVVLAAAWDWCLPPRYVRALARHAPSRWPGSRPAETGEVA